MTIASHPVGTFCVVDLFTPDPAAAGRFYGPLLGWTLADQSRAGDGAAVFRAGQDDVAGVRPQPGEAAWIPYVHVANVDATVARATGLGAGVVAPPADAPGMARWAIIRDPEGAVLGLWEPHGYAGTQLENGVGSLWWVELATGDMAAARAFYAALFDWGLDHTMRFDNGPHGYTLFKVGDRSCGGAFQFDPEWGLTPTWQVYFEVADFEATAARACQMGGEQGFWRDAPHAGRIGVLVDPAGASFLIAQPLPATPPSPVGEPGR